MNQSQLLAYVSQHLPAELQSMQTGGYATAHPMSAEEKAPVCHYTANGSTAINQSLGASQGIPANALTRELVATVQKNAPLWRQCV